MQANSNASILPMKWKDEQILELCRYIINSRVFSNGKAPSSPIYRFIGKAASNSQHQFYFYPTSLYPSALFRIRHVNRLGGIRSLANDIL